MDDYILYEKTSLVLQSYLIIDPQLEKEGWYNATILPIAYLIHPLILSKSDGDG